jgi:hypothetical protein
MMEKPLFRRKVFDLPSGERIAMFSVLEDKYRVWVDLQGFHRWSLTEWPDDGMGGFISHGKAITLNKAVEACRENDELRKEIYG